MTGQRVGFVMGTTSGGIWRHVTMLAAGCARDGLDVTVFGPEATRALPGGGPAGAGRAPGPVPAGWRFEPVRVGDRPRPLADLRTVFLLRRRLGRAGPDVVHAHGLRAGALTALALRPGAGTRRPAAAALRPAAGARRPGAGRPAGRAPGLVVTVHNAPPSWPVAAAVYRLLERLVASRADVVLCVSADLAGRMRRRGARDVRHAVIAAPASAPLPGPASLAPASIPAPAGIPAADGRPVVLAAGRLASQKGFGTLIEAAARWQGRQRTPLLLIAGGGPLAAALAAQARRLAVPATLLGVRDDIPALLAAADVFVLPSRWEGQPLILAEALRAGCPIVATKVGGVPALTGPDAALLVPPGDPDALASAVRRVLDDRHLAARLARAARNRAGCLPSEADAVRAARAVYDQLTAGCQGASSLS